MNAKELYEVTKGKKVSFNKTNCIVCGYLKESYFGDPILIVAFLMKQSEYSWTDVGSKDVIVTHKNNKYGYAYISKDYLKK